MIVPLLQNGFRLGVLVPLEDTIANILRAFQVGSWLGEQAGGRI